MTVVVMAWGRLMLMTLPVPTSTVAPAPLGPGSVTWAYQESVVAFGADTIGELSLRPIKLSTAAITSAVESGLAIGLGDGGRLVERL